MFVFFIIFIIHYFIFLYSSTLSCDEGEYIAIPGTAERSVQHLITRVWSAGGHSSSSYKHIIQCILYVVTYSYISGITTIPKQSECNVNSYNKDTIAICTCECPDLMKPYMQKTCDVAGKAILAKINLRKKCVNRDKM